MNRTRIGARSKQRGITLFVALIFLAVILMLGVAGMTMSTTMEFLSRASRDYVIALSAADSALRGAEVDIATPPGGGRTRDPTDPTQYSCACTNGLCVASQMDTACATSRSSTVILGYLGTIAKLEAFQYPPTATQNPYGIWDTNTPVSLGQYSAGAPTLQVSKLGGGTAINGGVSKEPTYIIEYFNDQGGTSCSMKAGASCPVHYRITAAGYGPQGNRAMVQETFRP